MNHRRIKLFFVSPTTIFANAVIRINVNSFLHLCDVYLMMICMASNTDRSNKYEEIVYYCQGVKGFLLRLTCSRLELGICVMIIDEG